VTTRGDLGTLARSAGAVVFRRDASGAAEFLLVHRPRYDDWSLPKGTLSDAESYPVAALREVEEETGFTGRLGPAIGSIGYPVRRGPKVVRYWLVEADRGRFKRNNEVDNVAWVPLATALEMASYAHDVNVLDRAARMLAQPRTAIVHLVRHANAGNRNGADVADHERPLSGRGRRQVALITNRLLGTPVSRIESSYYVRCEETVASLASALDLPIGHEPSLVEGGGAQPVIDFLHSLHSDAAVLCSHGDVITAVVDELAARGAALGSTLVAKKASVWELDLLDGTVVAGRYVPPPA